MNVNWRESLYKELLITKRYLTDIDVFGHFISSLLLENENGDEFLSPLTSAFPCQYHSTIDSPSYSIRHRYIILATGSIFKYNTNYFMCWKHES